MLIIKSEEVLADLRSAAWLEQELHGDLYRHRRHQMADICEADNVDRVWRVLGAAVAEVRLALLSILRPETQVGAANEVDRPDAWTFGFLYPLPQTTVRYVCEKIHEYLVSSVMSDRAAVIIPACAGIWRERAAEALAVLRTVAATSRRAQAPPRRPLWPC